jgi:hypothetical protein
MTDDDEKSMRRAAAREFFRRNPEKASRFAGAVFGSFLESRYPSMDFSKAKIVLEDGRELALNSEEGIEEASKLIATIPGGAAFLGGAIEASFARRVYEAAEQCAAADTKKKAKR